jgi:hypothetical protein
MPVEILNLSTPKYPSALPPESIGPDVPFVSPADKEKPIPGEHA